VVKSEVQLYTQAEPEFLSRCRDGLRAGEPGFDSRHGQGIFLFFTASRPTMGPTLPPIQWVPSAISRMVTRPGSEADHSSPSNDEVKGGGAIPPLLQNVFIS
jgi:hypothetical protein